jgi:hypothetical protein
VECARRLDPHDNRFLEQPLKASSEPDGQRAVRGGPRPHLLAAETRICHIDEGFDFLGWRIQRHQQPGSQRRYVYTYPSKKALGAVTGKVRALSKQHHNLPLAAVLHTINPVLRGWTAYFKPGVSSATFQYLRAFTGARSWAGCAASTPG